MSSGTDTGTKVLLGATVLMALAMAGIVWFILTSDSDDPPPPLPKAINFWLADYFSCNSASFEDDCPAGMMCLGETCRVERRIKHCRDGEPVGECICAPPFSANHRNLCVEKPEPPPREICKDPDIRDALLRIESECKKRKKTIHTCTPQDIDEFLMDQKQFQQVIAAFPGRVSLHFPNNMPKNLEDKTWASERVIANYKAELEPFRESFEDAKMFFLVARTSAAGSSDTNYKIALARIDFVNILLEEMLEIQKGQETPVFRHFNLGEAVREMLPPFFSQFYTGKFITWKPQTTANMKVWLEGYESLGRGYKKGLKGLVNRVVYIIPIPCELDEITQAEENNPEPTFPSPEPKQVHG